MGKTFRPWNSVSFRILSLHTLKGSWSPRRVLISPAGLGGKNISHVTWCWNSTALSIKGPTTIPYRRLYTGWGAQLEASFESKPSKKQANRCFCSARKFPSVLSTGFPNGDKSELKFLSDQLFLECISQFEASVSSSLVVILEVSWQTAAHLGPNCVDCFSASSLQWRKIWFEMMLSVGGRGGYGNKPSPQSHLMLETKICSIKREYSLVSCRHINGGFTPTLFDRSGYTVGRNNVFSVIRNKGWDNLEGKVIIRGGIVRCPVCSNNWV